MNETNENAGATESQTDGATNTETNADPNAHFACYGARRWPTRGDRYAITKGDQKSNVTVLVSDSTGLEVAIEDGSGQTEGCSHEIFAKGLREGRHELLEEGPDEAGS